MRPQGFSSIIVILLVVVVAFGLVVSLKFLAQKNSGILLNNAEFYETVIENGAERLKIRRHNNIPVPNVPGRIAFVRDNNIWMAEKGKAFQVTGDATTSFSKTFDYALFYNSPVWSPDGKYLMFIQEFKHGDFSKILLTDGNYVYPHGNSSSGFRHKPYWYSDTNFITSYIDQYRENMFTDDGVIISGDQIEKDFFITSAEPRLYFTGLETGMDGCGGGGYPLWTSALLHNEGAYYGIRSTLFYIKSKNQAVFSIGCHHEQVKRTGGLNGETSQFFNPTMKYDNFDSQINQKVPRSLTLASDEQFIIGIIGGNVTQFDLDGNVLKSLTQSEKAYGPVISHDNNYIYYADNYASHPVLKKVDLNGNQAVLFEADALGAISNISVSPDNSQIMFTLITQIGPEDNWETSRVTQKLYLVNTDGSNLKVFLDDAYQGVWGNDVSLKVN